MSRSTYQIERDDDYARGRGESSFGSRSFSQMVDDAARAIGGSEVISNLGAQARANPVPLALVGIGIAWLLSGRSMGMSFGGSRSSYGGYDYDDDFDMPSRSSRSRGGRSQSWNENNGEATWVEDDSEAGGSWVDAAGNVLSSAAASVASAASTVRDSVTGGASYVASTARHGGESVYSGASRLGSSAYSQASHLGSATRSTFSDVLEEEPLILGALGVAVGAAIGAMMPSTDIENRYVGQYRDRLRDDAEQFARDQFERGKAVASEALRSAKEEAEAQGLSSSGMQDVADRARDAARDIANAAMDGAKSAASDGGSGKGSSGSTGSGGSVGSGSTGSGTTGGRSTS